MVGWGPDTFQIVFGRHRPPDYADVEWDVTPTRAHNVALHALEVLAPDIPRAPLETGPALHPVAAHRDHYRARAQEYDRLYRAVIAPDAAAAVPGGAVASR